MSVVSVEEEEEEEEKEERKRRRRIANAKNGRQIEIRIRETLNRLLYTGTESSKSVWRWERREEREEAQAGESEEVPKYISC